MKNNTQVEYSVAAERSLKAIKRVFITNMQQRLKDRMLLPRLDIKLLVYTNIKNEKRTVTIFTELNRLHDLIREDAADVHLLSDLPFILDVHNVVHGYTCSVYSAQNAFEKLFYVHYFGKRVYLELKTDGSFHGTDYRRVINETLTADKQKFKEAYELEGTGVL